MAQKPSIPKGTRDFNPEEVAKRNYIFETIRSQFELYGFQPIETPSFENSETLMGKYGEEGDRLIFKIIDSGDYLNSIEVSSRGMNSIQLNRILKIENEILNGVISFLKDEIFIRERTQDILEQFRLRYSNSEDIMLLEKFLFYKKPKNKRSKKELSKYINFLTPNILKGNIKKSFKQSRLGNFSKSSKLTIQISNKALRYDLTVPFARYVVQHQNEMEFPFKRYQIQPVWRADRPQKGRFREFYQCDADVVGSQSLWQEVEFVQLYDGVFSALKLEGVTIKINNRKILSGIAEVIGAQDKLIDFTVALDKLDKIGEDKVKEEMLGKGIPQGGIDTLQPLFRLSGSFSSKIKELKSILSSSEQGKKGIEELEFINNAISELGLKTASLELDVTLARGLNYYTGAIFEVSAPKGVDMGSIGGGGRYDDLTGIFGLPNVSGVGISFGLDRIYLVLEALGLFPETINNSVKALFINFGEKEALACLKAIKLLRSQGIKAELFPDTKKTIKQMNYANKRNIPYVILVGESELQNNTFTLKNMISGTQQQLVLTELINTLK
ncbi:MAG: histidine--tRNA ligase [Gelidibacter sp.]